MVGRVIVEGDGIRLLDDGRLLDEQRRENLNHIYHVFAGSDILPDESRHRSCTPIIVAYRFTDSNRVYTEASMKDR
jgi:hypothetical protein